MTVAEIRVKLFGVLRVDTRLAEEKVNVEKIADIFDSLNRRVDEVYIENRKEDPSLEHPDRLSFKDAIIYVNGERCSRKGHKLSDGDEVWLLSPASGG